METKIVTITTALSEHDQKVTDAIQGCKQTINNTVREHKQTVANTIERQVKSGVENVMEGITAKAAKHVMEKLDKEDKFDNEKAFKEQVDFLKKAVYALIGVVSFLLFILIVAMIYMCTQSGQPPAEMYRRQLRRRAQHRQGQRKHQR